MRFILLLSVACLVITTASCNTNNGDPLAWRYLSPTPGSPLNSQGTTLALRNGDRLDPRSISADQFSVIGNKSGIHPGEARLALDGCTLLFIPDRPFAEGENVTVSVAGGIRTKSGRSLSPANFTFSTIPYSPGISAEIPVTSVAGLNGAGAITGTMSYRTYPELSNVMPITVSAPASGTAPGYIFLTGMGLSQIYDPAIMIIDDAGQPVYIQSFANNTPRPLATDFKKQSVGGQDYLVYHLGWQPNIAWTNGKGYVLDQSYAITNTWNIANGYEAFGADLHDLQLLDNGNALLLSYVPVPYDLTRFGGPADGSVVDMVIQEQDSARNVVFEWRGLQHVPLTNSYFPLTATLPVDYMHTNAIEPDRDGNLLISNRNTSDVIKIDRNTGKVLWRMGGRNNEFNFSGDSGFWLQHDVRRLPNGNITLFDNGNFHSPSASRQVEYQIDEVNKVVTRTWQFPLDASRFTNIMANAQRLPNGNTIGSWAVLNKVTEVTPNGSVAIELKLGEWSYRAFRDTWEATPRDPARLIALTGTDPTTATLYFAWNGATDIKFYQIYAGPTITSTTLLTTTGRTGFESSVTLSNLPANTCVFQVRPVRLTGGEMPLSNVVSRRDTSACALR